MTKKYRYQELVNLIIEDYCQKLAVGEFLPGMAELCRKYDTSEITVKKTMSLLSEHGIVKRIPGKGTVILDSPALKNSLKVYIPQHKLRILTLTNWDFSNFLEEQAVRYSKINPEIQFTFERREYLQYHDIEKYDLLCANEWIWANSQCEQFMAMESVHGLNFNPDSFFPEILRHCRRDGQSYFLPLGFSPTICIYNLDRPEIAQIDYRDITTFDQFTETMVRIKNGKLKYPFFNMNMIPGNWSHFIYSCRGDIRSLDSPESLRGLTVMHDMLHRHHICPTVNDYTWHWNLFNTGRFTVTWAKYGRIRAGANFRMGLAPLPYGEVPNGALYLEGVMLPKASKKLPQIKDFLNFLLNTEAQLELCTATAGVSTHKIAAEYYVDRLKGKVRGAECLLTGLENTRAIPDSPETVKFLRSVTVPLQMLTIGVYDPREFAAEAVKIYQSQQTTT